MGFIKVAAPTKKGRKFDFEALEKGEHSAKLLDTKTSKNADDTLCMFDANGQTVTRMLSNILLDNNNIPSDKQGNLALPYNWLIKSNGKTEVFIASDKEIEAIKKEVAKK